MSANQPNVGNCKGHHWDFDVGGETMCDYWLLLDALFSTFSLSIAMKTKV
jgi:hypothetical protein